MSDRIRFSFPEPEPIVCPICGGESGNHPKHEPDPKLGMSWWKRLGYNAPNKCASALREAGFTSLGELKKKESSP